MHCAPLKSSVHLANSSKFTAALKMTMHDSGELTFVHALEILPCVFVHFCLTQNSEINVCNHYRPPNRAPFIASADLTIT